jgi:hypothetical protein
MKRVLTAAVATACVGVLGACTPAQVRMWKAWHAVDPAAAGAFAADQLSEAGSQPVGVWDALAVCESGGDWGINTGNGYYGGLQFSSSAWLAYGGGEFASRADLASRDEEITVADRVRADGGFGAWPTCAGHLGLL